MNAPVTQPPTATPRFDLFTAVSPIHDPAALESLVAAYAAPLRRLGAEAWTPAQGRPAAPPVVFVATGGTERLILDAAGFAVREPALLVAHPGHNSLPAALEVLARLQQQGIRGGVHYLGGPDDEKGLRRLAEALHDLHVRRALLASRIGLVGEPSDWLVASSPTAETLERVWGPHVVPVPLDAILAEPDGEAVARGDALARDFRAGATALVEPAEPDVSAAGSVHELLRRVVDAGRFDAVAVRCFDLVMRSHTTGCLALAQLNDQGILAGCEGDLCATVAMLWVHRMTGRLSWMANPSRADLDSGVLALAHCTVPRALSGPYRLRSHFESGLGVGIQAPCRSAPSRWCASAGRRWSACWRSTASWSATPTIPTSVARRWRSRSAEAPSRSCSRAP